MDVESPCSERLFPWLFYIYVGIYRTVYAKICWLKKGPHWPNEPLKVTLTHLKFNTSWLKTVSQSYGLA